MRNSVYLPGLGDYAAAEPYEPQEWEWVACDECDGKGCDACEHEGGFAFGEAMSHYEYERQMERMESE